MVLVQLKALISVLELTVINVFSAFEKSWNIMLQHCESFVEFLQDTNNSVVFLHIFLGHPQRYLGVETPGKNVLKKENCSGISMFREN